MLTDRSGQVKQADVVIAAIGQPHYVKGDWLKPGAIVIDVGTNVIPGQSCPTCSSKQDRLTMLKTPARNLVPD